MLLSTPEVRTVLTEKKPQIQRAVKKPPTLWNYWKPYEIASHEGNFLTNEPSGRWSCSQNTDWPIKAPYKRGDVLYVRETWGIGIQLAGTVIYKADYPEKRAPLADGEKWKPATRMPREVARIFLRVDETQVECIEDVWFWIFGLKKLIGNIETIQKHIL